MDLSETDDHLTIVNRSKEYRIDKQLVRKIPYFDAMLTSKILNSKENKFVFDFDEKAFKIILDWVEMDIMYIKMDYVILLCNMADFFGMNDKLKKDCFNYFIKNFTIKNLPTVLHQVTPKSELLNLSVLDTFICRHFLKIVNSTVWLNYPPRLIEFICKLNLMISSEFQVFDAIMKWVDGDVKSRKYHLKALLKLVRWCYMGSKHLADINKNDLYKSIDFQPTCCVDKKTQCDCVFNRAKQKYFIAMEELSSSELRIKVVDRNFLPLINKAIKLDESIPLRVLHDKHVTDIVFDSGRQMVRIDWKREKYRLFDYSAYVSYYLEIGKYTIKPPKSKCQVSKSYNHCSHINGHSLLEANGKFILLRIVNGAVFCSVDPTADDFNPTLCDSYNNDFIATIWDQNIYILTKNLEFIKLNTYQNELCVSDLEKLNGKLKFDDLFLASAQSNEIFLVDKSSKSVFRFSVSNQEWNQIGLLVNYNCSRTDGSKEPKLLALTSAFLSKDGIRPYLKRKVNSNENSPQLKIKA